MSHLKEYNNTTTQQPCSYTTLGTYGRGGSKEGFSDKQNANSKMSYKVPSWEPLTYDGLQSGTNCNGYTTIENAYGKNCNVSYSESYCG